MFKIRQMWKHPNLEGGRWFWWCSMLYYSWDHPNFTTSSWIDTETTSQINCTCIRLVFQWEIFRGLWVWGCFNDVNDGTPTVFRASHSFALSFAKLLSAKSTSSAAPDTSKALGQSEPSTTCWSFFDLFELMEFFQTETRFASGFYPPEVGICSSVVGICYRFS